MIKKTENKKKVAIYIRVSSEEQKKEGLSSSAQKRKLESYAILKDWFVYKIYEDLAISGKIPIKKRPQGKQMFDDLEEGKFSAILIFKLDRGFRNTIDAILTSEELRNKNVDLISLSEQIDTTTAMGRFFFTLMSALAQFERELTTERLELTTNDKFERGIFIGKIPFGYEPVFQNKKERKIVIGIKPHPKNSPIIRDIFDKTINHISYKEICRKYKLKPQSYYNIIRNKVYLGFIEYKGKSKEGKHEPIISEETFIKVQNLLNK